MRVSMDEREVAKNLTRGKVTSFMQKIISTYLSFLFIHDIIAINLISAELQFVNHYTRFEI